MSLLKRLLFLSLFIFSFCQPRVGLAKEVIEYFHSDIQVFDSGDMQVTETIVVQSEQNKIKRGIYRDFPTKYKDRHGNNYEVGFKILSIKRDGLTESYHMKAMSNGQRIYIGNKDTVLSKGRHEFEITYRTNRQLGFFDERDELYWNVTGNDWAFPILDASASIVLPAGIRPSEIETVGYTGPAGSREQNYSASVSPEAISNFQTTRRLRKKEGLTIVVGFPKGHVIEPDLKQNISYVLHDNAGIAVGCAGLLLLIAYYFYVWSRVGKDPEKGVIIAEYEPPDGYSPAAMRYISEMGYDQTCFTAAIVNLAVKGYLRIEEMPGKVFFLQKEEGATAMLAAGEEKLLKKLFDISPRLDLKKINHQRISAALDAHESSLEKNYEKNYFQTNSRFFIVGLVVTAVVMFAAVFTQLRISGSDGQELFLMVWLSIWTVAVSALLKNAWSAWRRVTSLGSVMGAIHATLFASIFVFFEVLVFVQIVNNFPALLPALLIIAVIINWLFYELLKAPTRAGRKLLDKVEGFKRYIDIAERHELEYKYAGGKTPKLFERILPYAIALGVEKSWGKQFEKVLAQATLDEQDYSPRWYRGPNWNHSNISGFTGSVSNSLGNAIASSSTAPGSSSGGFSSGGSSGGGGGGGGGGGW